MVRAAATLTYVTARAPLCRAADTEAAVVGCRWTFAGSLRCAVVPIDTAVALGSWL
jgi:hypothetical protein